MLEAAGYTIAGPDQTLADIGAQAGRPAAEVVTILASGSRP